MDLFEYISKEQNINALKQEFMKMGSWAAGLESKLKSNSDTLNLIINSFDFDVTFPISDNPKVSIVIPVKNQFEYTKVCLNSLFKNTQGIDYEVIIADDNSDDSTKNIDKYFKNVQLVKNDTEYFGFVGNVTNAISKARGEYIFLMNNDMVTTPKYLSELLSVIEKDSTIGIAGSENLNSNNTILEAGVKMDSHGMVTFLGQNGPLKYFDKQEYIDVDYCSGCAILFKKTVWDETGGFDMNYAPSYYEDSDFAMKLKYEYNLRSVCVPKSKIYHFKGVSYEKTNKSHVVNNRNYFLMKWHKYLHD